MTAIVAVTRCATEILDLRTAGYSTREYDVGNIATMADEFDERSDHVSVWLAKTPVATARLTPGPRSVFEQWSQGKANIPTGEHVVDISRVAVRPDMRQLGLSSFVVLEALNQAAQRDFQFVVGATVLEGALLNFMTRIGFEAAGDIVELLESQGQRVRVQPMVLTPSPDLVRLWHDTHDDCLRRLARHGLIVQRANETGLAPDVPFPRLVG
jgi:predicted GNAT family N-acyltransferase